MDVKYAVGLNIPEIHMQVGRASVSTHLESIVTRFSKSVNCLFEFAHKNEGRS